MPVVRLPLPSLAVGTISAAVGSAAGLGVFYALFLVFALTPTAREARVPLAMVTSFVPVAAGAMSFMAAILALEGHWGADLRISAIVAGVLLGGCLLLLLPLASATNDCLFDYAFPLRGYDPCD